MYRLRNIEYLHKLLATGKKIYTTAEIATIWGISNKNTLHTYLRRYTDRHVLFRLGHGTYSLIDPNQLHPYEIAVALAGELAYISLETVLFTHGIINQPVYKITLVGKKNKEFRFLQHDCVCRYLSPQKLVDRWGITDVDGYAMADADRALADMRLLKPNYYKDLSL